MNKLSVVSKGIVDTVVDQLTELEEDNSRMHHEVSNLEQQIELKDIEIDQLTANLAELAEYVQELETALAEAHLMSTDDGPTTTC